MKKFACMAAVLTACLLALPASGQEKEELAAYGQTMSHLDKNGLVLTYRDTGNGMSLEREAISLILSMVSRELGSDQDSQSVIKALGELFRESGICSIRAIGSSVSKQKTGLYLARYFFCMPEGSTGLLKDIQPSNRPVSDFFGLIPREAFVAGGTAFRLGPAFEKVMSILKRTLAEEEYAKIEGALSEAKKDGVDIPALLDTVRGAVFYLENVPGKDPVFVPGFTGGALLLETTDDSVYRLILTKEDPENIHDGAVVLDQDMHVEMIQSGKYLILSNDIARVKDILAGKVELLDRDPVVRKVIPAEKEALGVFVWTPGLGALANSLVSMFAPEEYQKDAVDLIRIIGLNEPLCSVSVLEKDGVANLIQTTVPGLLCSMAASAPGGNNMASVPVLAGMVLPAIQQARMKAQMLKDASDPDNK